MGRRSGLGRGLGALIPSAPPVGADVGPSLRELPIESVRPNRYQPRSVFDDAALAELAASIEVLGVLQPILVRPVEPEGEGADGSTPAYEIIAGERRWRAAQIAGCTHIPALIRDVVHQQSLEHALVENLQREDLNPVEEAVAFRQLVDDFSLSHEEVATQVGRSRSAVTNTLRLLQLPPSVLELVAVGTLGAGHGRALLGLDTAAEQESVAAHAVSAGWSVRRVEAEVKRRQAAASGPADGAGDGDVPPGSGLTDRPAALLELEGLLSDHLATRVAVQLGGKRGRIVIDFAGIEDLERIYRAMVDGREAD